MKSSAICQLAGFLLFLPFLLLPAEPILSTEYAEEAAGEAVTFPQIFTLLAVLFLGQLVLAGCLWLICLAARKTKDNAKLKTGVQKDGLPPTG